MSTGQTPYTPKFMVIRGDDYRRLCVADMLVSRLLDAACRSPQAVTAVGNFDVPDDARCLAREWLALGGVPANERRPAWATEVEA